MGAPRGAARSGASCASTARISSNIERIAKVELYAKDSRVAILRDGTRLPVSRAGYARLSKFVGRRPASGSRGSRAGSHREVSTAMRIQTEN